ncbi:MAG: hypothetical protein H7333_03920 [Bdellovibrionales bacterium]|nr:hypothetical protein [Oligoflexia bacterium]
MKNWLIVFLLCTTVFLFYQNYSLRQERKNLSLQVSSLSAQSINIQKNLEKNTSSVPSISETPPIPSDRPAKEIQLNAEKQKLQAFLSQRKQAASLVSNRLVGEQQRLNQEIQNRQANLQSIQQQLRLNQTSQLRVEQSGNLAQSSQTQAQVQNISTLNEQIQTQEGLIRTLQTQINSWKQSDSYERLDRMSSLNATLSAEKQNLTSLRQQKQLTKESHSLQSNQVQNQVNLEKGRIRLSDQEMRSQVDSLSTDLKQLNAQKEALRVAPANTDLTFDLDRQIKTSQSLILNLEAALKEQSP